MIQSHWQVQKLENAWAILAPVLTNPSCCGPGAGCGIFAFAQMFGRSKNLKIPNNQDFKEGSLVVLEITEGDFLKLTARTYVLPLVFLVGGAFLGRHYAGTLGVSNDVAAILGGITGLLVAFLWLKRKARRHLVLDSRFVRIRLTHPQEPILKR